MSKRQRKVEAMLVNNFTANNAVRLDSYRKPTQQRPIQLLPKSLSQETYIDLLEDTNKLIIFATGPAGTGKTMLAVVAAIKAYKEGKMELALELFNHELDDNPKNSMAYHYRSLIYQSTEDYSKSLTDINKAIGFIPKKEKKWLARSEEHTSELQSH